MARFATVEKDQYEHILSEMNSINTHKGTMVAWNQFECYMKEKGINIDPKTVSKSKLNEILKNFYVEVRKVDGGQYKKNTLNSIRFGLQRKFKQLNSDMDIIADTDFTECNLTFKAQCVQLKKNGLANTDHKPPISPEDIQKLYDSDVFSLSRPESLQRKVFFEIMLFLCRRGRENLRALTKDSLAVKIDGNGVEYIEKVVDELSKNHRENDVDQEGGVIYATGGKKCPVASFKLYIQKLNPKLNAFFQRPKVSPLTTDIWYDAQVLGVKSIAKMMKRISTDAGLSFFYTNHSIRATSISVLDSRGFEARHIMALSGHRSENSIRSYSRTDIGMKRKMSDNLANFVYQKNFKPNFSFGIDFDKHEENTKCPTQSVVGSNPGQPSNVNQINSVNHHNCLNNAGNSLGEIIRLENCDGVNFSNCTFNLR